VRSRIAPNSEQRPRTNAAACRSKRFGRIELCQSHKGKYGQHDHNKTDQIYHVVHFDCPFRPVNRWALRCLQIYKGNAPWVDRFPASAKLPIQPRHGRPSPAASRRAFALSACRRRRATSAGYTAASVPNFGVRLVLAACSVANFGIITLVERL